MSENNFKVLLFYKYVSIAAPEILMKSQNRVCRELNLKGRVIIATEGINATLEGRASDIEQYCKLLTKDPRFTKIHFKISDGNGQSFPKLSVKVRDEIVSTHLGDRKTNPNKVTGKYLTAPELHQWFTEGVEFYIVDMRNDYEHAVGHFQNSILPALGHFRDLPRILDSTQHLKHKRVLTVCTGGVRCETASGFLIENGFSDVYQLFGGIVTYMENYPNQNFLGKLYVFDQRVIMGFNTDSPKHKIVGKCLKCESVSEDYTNCSYNDCHKHFICCLKCRQANNLTFCQASCEMSYYKLSQFS